MPFNMFLLFFLRLAIIDTALNLMNTLTSKIIDLEIRLISQASHIDDEHSIHRQLNNLNELHNDIQILEKSITELLQQSKQLGDDRLIRISERLASKWKQMTSEIIQRFITYFFDLFFNQHRLPRF